MCEDIVEHYMKLGSTKLPPAGRVVFFIIGAGSALLTLKTITKGVIRIGGFDHARADNPIDFWCVMAVMAFLSALWIFVALVKPGTKA